MSASNTTHELVELTPDMLEQWLGEGDTVLVDVREGFEHAGERIENAQHHALSKFDREQLHKHHEGKRVVFHCRSGKRSADAASQFGPGTVYHLTGGIEEWKASGRSTIKSASAPKIDVMRQVQITAGSLVVLGVVLGVLVHPGFLAISAFVGCGLTFAGLSGWCGMAMLLAKMPWNKAVASGCTSCTT